MEIAISRDEKTGATVVTHDAPDDVPVAVVFDCSPPTSVDVDAETLLTESVELMRAGDIENGNAKFEQAKALLEQSATARVAVQPLTAEEIALRDATATTNAAAEAVAAKAATVRQALIDKLAAGTATAAEQQSALAQLLGGPATT